MKKSRKSFLLAMMAILVAAGLAGCGRGNSASGQQTENANGQTDQLAQAQTEDAEKDSVIVVMGPSSEVSISVARSYPMVRSLFVTVNVLWISGS